MELAAKQRRNLAVVRFRPCGDDRSRKDVGELARPPTSRRHSQRTRSAILCPYLWRDVPQLRLESVIFVAGDYHGRTINLSFAAPGPVSKIQAAQYASLAGCSPPTDQEFEDMREFLNLRSYTFAVTMEYETGRVTRVAFYAVRLPLQKLPITVDDRIRKFFSETPSYDQERTRFVAWSYGRGDCKFMKAETSYVGEWAALLRESAPPPSS